MYVNASHWMHCDAGHPHYRAVMPTRKKNQRTVRVPADLEAEIQRLAKSLHEVGLLPEPSWSGALLMVLMQARKAGLLDVPPKWYSPPEEATPRSKK